MADQEPHDSVIPRREELVQALTAGLGLAAQALGAFGAATLRAARTLESLAEKLDEDQEPEPPVEPPVSATGPTASPEPPAATGPTGPPQNP